LEPTLFFLNIKTIPLSPIIVNTQKKFDLIIPFAPGFLLFPFVPSSSSGWGGVITNLLSVTLLFLGYSLLQFGATQLLRKNKFSRQIDFFLCSVDLVTLSIAIHWTGGASSPLYFVYFIPLIIQAFHRDWGLTLYNGFGGVLFYAIAISLSSSHWTQIEIINFGTRLFFMLLTVSISAMAVSLLRKKATKEHRRFNRMRLLTHISQGLNRVHGTSDLMNLISSITKALNHEFKEDFNAWCRMLILQKDGLFMGAISDPENTKPELKQKLEFLTCPVIANHKPFELNDAERETPCPIENFSFSSHLCIPIMGSQNEYFGVIFAGSPHANIFLQEETQFLSFIGRSVGLAIQRLNKMDELRMNVDMNSCATAGFMTSMKTLSLTYNSIVTGLRDMLEVDQVSLMIWQPKTGELKVKEVEGPLQSLERGKVVRMGEGIAGRVLESGQPFCTHHEHEGFEISSKETPFKSLLSLPITNIKGEPLGVLNARTVGEKRFFSAHEIEAGLTFATRAAMAIENALLHEKERGESQSKAA